MDMKKVYGYRKMISNSQKDMADKLGLSENGYRRKELGHTEFKRNEMEKFTKLVKELIPEIDITDIFF